MVKPNDVIALVIAFHIAVVLGLSWMLIHMLRAVSTGMSMTTSSEKGRSSDESLSPIPPPLIPPGSIPPIPGGRAHIPMRAMPVPPGAPPFRTADSGNSTTRPQGSRLHAGSQNQGPGGRTNVAPSVGGRVNAVRDSSSRVGGRVNVPRSGGPGGQVNNP